MPSDIFGLPLHPLIVHATAVLVPLSALLVIAIVISPRLRAWAGPLPMGLALVGLILTPLSTASGENLEKQVGESSLVEKHAELGDQLLPLTIALFVFTAAYWWLGRRAATTADGDVSTPARAGSAGIADRMRTITVVVGVLALLAAVGTGVQVARIGHSGAKAAWSDTGSASG